MSVEIKLTKELKKDLEKELKEPISEILQKYKLTCEESQMNLLCDDLMKIMRKTIKKEAKKTAEKVEKVVEKTTEEAPQCVAVTKNKTQCTAKAKSGSCYCGRHSKLADAPPAVEDPEKPKTRCCAKTRGGGCTEEASFRPEGAVGRYCYRHVNSWKTHES
jgi:hypothetical protein